MNPHRNAVEKLYAHLHSSEQSLSQEYRAEKALAALNNLLPHHTTALHDGHAVQLPVSELVPGDVVLRNCARRWCADELRNRTG